MLRSLIAVLLVSLSALVLDPISAWAEPVQQGLRMPEIGGYGVVLYDAPTFEYGSLNSAVSGEARAGEIVYLNAWQIGVYHIGDKRWISQKAVQPIIDAAGRPVVGHVIEQGGTYYLNGRAITLPARFQPQADRFLANPDINAPVIYSGSTVPTDWVGDLVDTSAVRYSPGERVVATMRVTELYDFIYLRTAPSADAPKADFYAYPGEILTAYEVVDNQWYRIGPNVWAPHTWNGETLLVPENVAAYAPPEYYNGGKWISVDLNRQRLTAWEGNDVVVSAPVKTGKYGYYTPAGVWQIYEKVPNERMAGSDYDLQDVAWTMYYTRSRIAIHAAYWHHNYNGRPGSHGCVNTPVHLAKKLFMWAPVGTTVVAHNPYIFDAVDIANAQRWKQFDRYGP